MFDQSFTTKNFRKIYDKDRYEKGDIEVNFFPEAYDVRRKIQILKKLIIAIKTRLNSGLTTKSNYQSRKDLINERIRIRKEQYDKIVNNELEKISQIVNKKGYHLPLTKSPKMIKGKDVFSIGKNVESIFVSRHIQNILKSIYDIKLSNRDIIISRLSTIAADKSPKVIIRADIEKFYESIDHIELLSILHSSPNLSVTPRRILTQLIRTYSNLENTDKGLPRGVGISAYLSEIFMSAIDTDIKKINEITYYERYVDDLILIFSPLSTSSSKQYLKQIDSIVKKRNLSLNSKTKEIDLYTNSNGSFEYLGYLFNINNGGLKTSISNNKKKRYIKRIDKTFEKYKNEVKTTRNKAYKKIVSRIRFLTGNTRLHNNKSNAFVGIYFSNQFITDDSSLNGIDHYLTHKINSIQDIKLKKRLKKLSFKDGFNNRVYRNFTISELSDISRGWKNV